MITKVALLLPVVLLASPAKPAKPTAHPSVGGSVKEALAKRPLPAKPLTKAQIIGLARSEGVAVQESTDIGRTWVDAARPSTSGVHMAQFCAKASEINLDGTGYTLFDVNQASWCRKQGLPVGFEIRLNAKQNKGYVINCGSLRLKWTATQGSTQTTVAATRPTTPTYTFVARKTGTERIRFTIPKDHLAEYYEPRLDRCQVAEVG
ncbi:MAG: hypothetical protein ACRBN8_05325 [Nannocystales bacterium]